ncbi:MAG: Na/Pi cotransporter family protein [Anaerolineae bacterium]|jgi:phosphate:Na+ symporter|nr:Na/Pi cotransporter family protein [Anaerolineae bacterium]
MAQVLQVFGGMALFLLGVNMLSQGMEKLAGNKIQVWLDRMTNTHIKGAVFGAGATALLQSSSMVMVTMISLINANLMSLEQAISVMLGQEIGTTLTAQIAAFDMGEFFFLFVIAGFILLEFTSKGEWKKYGEIILGFGILFLGMETMTNALKTLVELPIVSQAMTVMCRNLFLGVLAGTIATAIVQSSSAVTGLVVALGLSGSISLPGAVALLLGANIGTCVTGLIAASRLSKASLQASLAQIFINVLGVLIFLPFINQFSNLVALTSSDLGRQIANAHTIFNVLVSLLMYPFIGLITKMVMKFVPVKIIAAEKLTHYIDEGQLGVPSIAMNEAYRELLLVNETCIEMVEKSVQALLYDDRDAMEWVLDKEPNYVDAVIDQLDMFVNHIYLTDLDEDQQKRTFQLKSLIVDIERVADLAENLAESAQEKMEDKVTFTEFGIKAIEELSENVFQSLRLAHKALRTQDTTLANQVIERESKFDAMYLRERQKHLKRLEDNICSAEADIIFLDSLRNLERISDHTENIAEQVLYNTIKKSQLPVIA